MKKNLILFLMAMAFPFYGSFSNTNKLVEENRKKGASERKIKKAILDEKKFNEELLKFAEKFIEETPRDIYIFSYSSPQFTVQAPYYKPYDPLQAQMLFRNVQTFFWENQRVRNAFDFPTWFGDGVYFATDPLISRGFGGSSPLQWKGIALRLPRGTRYLNIENQTLFDSFELGITLEHKYKCKATRLFHLFQANLTKMDASQCREVAKEFIRMLDVVGVAYGYHFSEGVQKKYCPNTRKLAFYLTPLQAPENENVITFTSTLPPEEEDSAMELRTAIQALANENGQRHLFWPKMKNQSMDLNQWTKDHVLDCQN